MSIMICYSLQCICFKLTTQQWVTAWQVMKKKEKEEQVVHHMQITFWLNRKSGGVYKVTACNCLALSIYDMFKYTIIKRER